VSDGLTWFSERSSIPLAATLFFLFYFYCFLYLCSFIYLLIYLCYYLLILLIIANFEYNSNNIGVNGDYASWYI
jgi:hypothetical protein